MMIGGHAADRIMEFRERMFPESNIYPGYYRLVRCRNIVLVVRRPGIVSTILAVVLVTLLIKCVAALFIL